MIMILLSYLINVFRETLINFCQDFIAVIKIIKIFIVFFW